MDVKLAHSNVDDRFSKIEEVSKGFRMVSREVSVGDFNEVSQEFQGISKVVWGIQGD